MSERPYVLGTGEDELARLGLQHRLWSDAAHAAWLAAGLAPGQRVLDVGCGPGYAAFDLAQIVGRAGAVLAVDESPGFVAHANEQAARRGLPQLRALVADAHALGRALAAEAPFDLAYARWVLCFVRDPEAVLRGVVERLRPKGRIVIHDYFNYGSMTMAPRRRSHDLAVAATMQSWRAQGGDPDVMARVPAMLVAAGCRIERLLVHQRIARGSEAMFAWPDTWWRTFAPKLVDRGLLAAADCAQLLTDLDAIRHSPADFVSCPPVYELIAVRC
ncbi:MAG: methyltransferase domain-containing protein [Planctomycetes bacterium]|nr:methyltransferase domain-containing protein [Planctomycetota bacterium]